MSSNLPTGPERSGPLMESVDEFLPPYNTHDLQGIEESEGGGVNLRRYLAALLRYKWLILVIAVLGTAAGGWLTTRIEPTYEARATIWVEMPTQGEAALGPIRAGQLLQTSGWIDLLGSFIVLDHVVMELRLYLEPTNPADSVLFRDFRLAENFRPGNYLLSVGAGQRFSLLGREGEVLQEGVLGDSVGLAQGFQWVPPADQLQGAREVRFTVRSPRDIARELSANLTPRMPPNSQFLRIIMTGNDPQKITSVVNVFIERYVEVAAELKNAKLDEQAELLFEQLQQAEANLKQADNELESFRIATITLPTERATPVAPGLEQTRDPVFTNFFNMKIEQDQLRRDREAIERALARATPTTPLSVAALEYIGAVRNSSELLGALQLLTTRRTELRALQAQYTDEHPAVQAMTDEVRTMERETIPMLARTLIAEIDNRDAQIEANVNLAAREMQQIPARQLEEAKLIRQVQMAQEIYGNLRMRYETARLAAASAIPDVRVLEPAVVPRRPVSNNGSRLILMAFMGSLGLGVAGALLLDRFDPKLRYPDQVTRGLRLNILGAIPYIKGQGIKGKPEDVTQVVEAFRELRLSLASAYGTAGPLVTVVTSSGSGDGKSFTSGNLALSFADLGYRTLLIDGDIRRGAQHRLLGVPGKPGLTDCLKGEATLAEVVKQTAYPLLYLLPCGTRLQGGVELLGSPRMNEMLRELKTRFQVIIIDSPPLGAGVDPFVLSTLAGHVMMVLRTDYTDRQFTEAKLELLERLPVRILGAVLNAVPPKGPYRYYSYLPGYEEIGEGLVLAGSAGRQGSS